MRLLHTGDWHLGKRLYGADRAEEAEAVLAQLAAVAEEEAVDAVLVSGDLLDRRVVDSAALGACLRGLERLAETAPVLAVAGNHDDPDLWGHLAPHLAASGIHVAGHVRPAAEAVVTVPTAAGPLHAALLPWPEPGRIALDAGASAGYARSRYADLVADVIDDYAAEAVARRRAEGGAAVLVGHLMVERARAGGGERELTMGMTYAVSPGALPVELDYLALGHVHRPQELTGLAAPGRYCGSPMALDFSEDNHPKTACVVEVGGGRATTRQVALRPPGPSCACAGASTTWRALASAHPGRVVRVRGRARRPRHGRRAPRARRRCRARSDRGRSLPAVSPTRRRSRAAPRRSAAWASSTPTGTGCRAAGWATSRRRPSPRRSRDPTRRRPATRGSGRAPAGARAHRLPQLRPRDGSTCGRTSGWSSPATRAPARRPCSTPSASRSSGGRPSRPARASC